jgi:hypothetical protein
MSSKNGQSLVHNNMFGWDNFGEPPNSHEPFIHNVDNQGGYNNFCT